MQVKCNEKPCHKRLTSSVIMQTYCQAFHRLQLLLYVLLKCRNGHDRLTEERRREISKDVAKYAEECKVAIRSLRRDANDKLKTLKKNAEITEDDQKIGEEKIQKLTDKMIDKIDKAVETKTKEIMTV